MTLSSWITSRFRTLFTVQHQSNEMPANPRRGRGRRGAHCQSDNVVSNDVGFDFGSGMPLPPTKHQPIVLRNPTQPELKEETPFDIGHVTFHGADDRQGGVSAWPEILNLSSLIHQAVSIS